MLAKLTLLAETSFPQSGGFPFPLKASTAYLFQTNNILDLKVYGTTDSEFTYLFSPEDKQTSRAVIRVDEAYSAIAAIATSDEVNRLIALSVIKDKDGEDVTETWYVNHDHIFLADEYDTDKTGIYLRNGGSSYKYIVVTESLDEIITLTDA